MYLICKLYGSVLDTAFKFIGASFVSVSRDKYVFGVIVAYKNRGIGSASDDVDMSLYKLPRAKLGIFCSYKSCRVSCREMVIVKEPYLHIALCGFLEDNIHIAPPGLP